MNIERTTSTGTSNVGNLVIRYEITKDGTGAAIDVQAKIYDGMTIIGTFNASPNGVLGISFRENSLTLSVCEDVVDQIIEDTDTIFNGSSSESSQASE